MTMPVPNENTIAAERLRLRPLVPSDAALLGLYMSDARVARTTREIPHPYPPGTAETFVERHGAGRPGPDVWAIDLGQDGDNGLIGLISLKPVADGEAEVSYWLAPAYWGTGYATEAVGAVVEEARRRGLRAVVADVLQDNEAAARVLTRCGFAWLGEGEAHSVARGAVCPTFRYRLDLAAA